MACIVERVILIDNGGIVMSCDSCKTNRVLNGIKTVFFLVTFIVNNSNNLLSIHKISYKR